MSEGWSTSLKGLDSATPYNGAYIAVEDDQGHTFIGTEAEAVEHMMAHSGH